MSNGGRAHRRWKDRRWRQDPRCAFCRRVTVLTFSGKYPPKNLATMDHLRDRYDPTRQEPIRNANEVRRVLACWECNHKRGAARTAALPKEELWKRAGHYDRMASVTGGSEAGTGESPVLYTTAAEPPVATPKGRQPARGDAE